MSFQQACVKAAVNNIYAKSSLLAASITESNPELRLQAIRELAMSGGQDELWQLYQSDSSVENRKAILQSMFLGGNSARLIEIARNQKDPALRVAAIKSLGRMGDNGRGDVLVSIYQSDPNREAREAALNSLFLQHNGGELVALARSEKGPRNEAKDRRKDTVRKCSKKRSGSSGRIRTYNPSVNSRMLYR